MQTYSKMPWGPGDNVVACLALHNLQDLLLRATNDQRGVHVETLMTLAGALAGFSVQHAIRKLILLGKTALDPALSLGIVPEGAAPMSKVDPRAVPQE